MTYYSIIVGYYFLEEQKRDEKSELIAQTIVDYVDNAVIKSVEVPFFVQLITGLALNEAVNKVSFEVLYGHRYLLKILFKDGSSVNITVMEYGKQLDTSMLGNIISAFSSADIFYLLPEEE